MNTIGIILLILTAISLIIILITSVKRAIERHKPEVKLCEPDLSLAGKPDCVAKIPENENRIPDSNVAALSRYSPPENVFGPGIQIFTAQKHFLRPLSQKEYLDHYML